MKERVERVGRILALQRQLHRIEEWRLADVQRRIAALEVAQHELINSLNEDDALHGLFIDTLARHLRALSEEAGRLAVEKELQSHRLIEHTTRLKAVERLFAQVDEALSRANDRKALDQLIDSLMSRRAASFP
jgi:uncharacterized coiled-coil protein SlyX